MLDFQSELEVWRLFKRSLLSHCYMMDTLLGFLYDSFHFVRVMMKCVPRRFHDLNNFKVKFKMWKQSYVACKIYIFFQLLPA